MKRILGTAEDYRRLYGDGGGQARPVMKASSSTKVANTSKSSAASKKATPAKKKSTTKKKAHS